MLHPIFVGKWEHINFLCTVQRSMQFHQGVGASRDLRGKLLHDQALGWSATLQGYRSPGQSIAPFRILSTLSAVVTSSSTAVSLTRGFSALGEQVMCLLRPWMMTAFMLPPQMGRPGCCVFFGCTWGLSKQSIWLIFIAMTECYICGQSLKLLRTSLLAQFTKEPVFKPMKVWSLDTHLFILIDQIFIHVFQLHPIDCPGWMWSDKHQEIWIVWFYQAGAKESLLE
jgi:hypothetical protein